VERSPKGVEKQASIKDAVGYEDTNSIDERFETILPE
jgi:hypothetical protein